MMKRLHRLIISKEYRVTSAELKEALKLDGEITSIDVWAQRSPKEASEGKSADEDVWCISTQELKGV